METEKKKVEVSLELASCDTASKLCEAVDVQRTLDEEKQVRRLNSCKMERYLIILQYKTCTVNTC